MIEKIKTCANIVDKVNEIIDYLNDMPNNSKITLADKQDVKTILFNIEENRLAIKDIIKILFKKEYDN